MKMYTAPKRIYMYHSEPEENALNDHPIKPQYLPINARFKTENIAWGIIIVL